MKKTNLIVSGLVLTNALFLGGSHSFAEEATTGNEATKANINLKAEDAVTPPLDPENPDNPDVETDPDNPGTGEKGVLTIDSVPTIQFGTKIIETKRMVYQSENANPFVQITDRRGTGEGWDLKAKITSFETTEEKTLTGAELTLQQPMVKTTSDNVSKAPVPADSVTLNGADQSLLTAEIQQGKGTWLSVYEGAKNANDKLVLAVPSGNDAGKYQATLTWTLENAI